MYLFSVIGLVGLIAFLGSCGTHCGEAYGMRYMLYFGWFLSSPIAIIGLLVTAVSLPAAIGAVEAC